MPTSRQILRRQLSCAVCLVSLVLAGTTQAEETTDAANKAELLDKIFDAWTKRQQNTKTLQATWQETIFQAADPAGDEPEQTKSQKLAFTLGPNGETSLISTPLPAAADNANGQVTEVSSFNGQRHFHFTSFVENKKDEGWPIGSVWDTKASDDAHAAQIRPWLLHLRPLGEPAPHLTRDNVKVVATDVDFQGRRCIVLERRDETPRIGVFYVDPQRDYAIIGYHSQVGDRLTLTMTVTPTFDRQLGWRPAQWDCEFANGRFKVSGVLLQCKVNVDLPPETFTPDFPRGTIVFDKDKGLRSLILGEGQRRIITPEESAGGFRYKDLFTTKSGDLAPAKRRGQ
ncbi:hypothetical protein [Blastopirellula marina]|uniref:Uncharacterized protein n=1 Tax=Blastopirellula marina TaxID=124 RepID=A0A2S8GSF3_9BACT|nr:hypothetical protein [Blastopirellula marina]PQO47350.1 hypothetical protein C5Y93_04730 [Blastopirellula marina]